MQNEIEFFINEYKKQKRLENYVGKRLLVRPKTKIWQAVTSVVFLPPLLFCLPLMLVNIKIKMILKLIVCLIWIILLTELYVRMVFILAVKCYQHYAKEETRRRCKCVPSCSEYAIIALKKIYPLLLALLKIRKRLFHTCSGEEYIIDFPYKKMEKNFEELL